MVDSVSAGAIDVAPPIGVCIVVVDLAVGASGSVTVSSSLSPMLSRHAGLHHVLGYLALASSLLNSQWVPSRFASGSQSPKSV